MRRLAKSLLYTAIIFGSICLLSVWPSIFVPVAVIACVWAFIYFCMLDDKS